MDETKYQVKLQPKQVIKCPHCNYEYLPCEVLYPNSVLGKIKLNSVIRDPLGHIIYEEWNEAPEAEERFTCENCDKQFVVEIETNYTVKHEEAELDFSTETVSLWD